MTINETEGKAQLLRKRHKTEEKFKDDTGKRRKLQNEVDTLEKTVRKQAKEIEALKSGSTVTTHHSQKSWSSCSRQQQYNKKKQLANELTAFVKTVALSLVTLN